jgi:hypothetical protein
VDNILKLITQAVENDQQDRLEAIVQSIKLRTNQLEEFYAQNEDGDPPPSLCLSVSPFELLVSVSVSSNISQTTAPSSSRSSVCACEEQSKVSCQRAQSRLVLSLQDFQTHLSRPLARPLVHRHYPFMISPSNLLLLLLCQLLGKQNDHHQHAQ